MCSGKPRGDAPEDQLRSPPPGIGTGATPSTSVGSPAAHDGRGSTEQDLDVERQGPVGNISLVEGEELRKVEIAAPENLPQTGEAGSDRFSGFDRRSGQTLDNR